MKRIPQVFSVLLVVALAVAVLPTATVFADTDILGPVTSAVVATPSPANVGDLVTVTATVDDTTTGASNILSAEFSVNGGPFTAMTAVDGAFDSATEDVTGSFTVAQDGTNQVCVQGTDALNNVGTATCIDLTATTPSLYTFTGFRPPIKMVGMHPRAGRNIPVKWNLKLAADGTPVSDLAAIVGVESYAVDCTTLTGDATTAVLESGPGNTHLRRQHAGKWVSHWKTSLLYAGTCRQMFVMFGDGTMSPTVLFSFR